MKPASEPGTSELGASELGASELGALLQIQGPKKEAIAKTLRFRKGVPLHGSPLHILCVSPLHIPDVSPPYMPGASPLHTLHTSPLHTLLSLLLISYTLAAPRTSCFTWDS